MEIVDSARFFEDKILSNHVVTDLLFGYLSKSELLECSLISKKWISPCRQFLQRHHECLLRLDNGELRLTPVALLKSVLITSKLLEDCDEIFYNGIFWNISIELRRSHITPNSKKYIQKSFEVIDSILKQLPKIKFLRLGTISWKAMGYFSLRRHYPIDLTEIEKLEIFGGITPRVYDAFFGKEMFPSLKTADISWRRFVFDDEAYIKILQRILYSTPVLQEWLSYVRQSDIKYFAEANKLATIQTVNIENWIEPELVDQLEAGNEHLGGLECHLVPTTENVEIFRRITSSSTATLMGIGLGYRFCKMLVTTPGIRPFINEKNLAITNDNFIWSLENMKADMEADSNFQRIFPNASVVRWLP